MPLRPGESFLEGSARVKRQRAGAAALRSFAPPLAPPPPKVPPVPKAVKQWERKSPTQKVKEAGFLGAVANDQAVARFKYERMAPTLARAGRLEAKDPALVRRDKALKEIVRLEKLPQKARRSEAYWTKLNQARREAYGEKHGTPGAQVLRGVYAGLAPAAERAWEHYTDKSNRRSYLGIQSTGIVEDLLETGAKMAAGLPVGVAGMARHPLRVPGQIKAIISDVAQPIGLAVAASKGDSGAWERLTKQLVQESVAAIEAQYGPQTSWSDSVQQSFDQGLIAALQGLAVVAPAARVAAPLGHVGRAAGAYGKGLAAGERVPLGQAWQETARPLGPRTVRLRGGPEAMGQPVEIQWSRSALGRGAQRAYDVASRRISEEAPIVGKLSEAQRAARASRKQVKRDIRRLQAEAANYATAAGRASEAEQLRAFYMRGKPEGVDEDAWLQAQLDDVTEMLAGREFIRPDKPNPKLAQLQRRVNVLQRKMDRTRARVEGEVIERRLAPLVSEERSLKSKIRSARERNRPTEELEARLGNVQDQLRVARGEQVGAVADSPARAQLKAVFDQQLGRKQSDLAIQAYDLAARAASPDNPSAFYDRIITQYADNPEAAGVDLANAFLQEAGPRRSLRGAPEKFTPEAVEQFRRYDSRVLTPEGEGWIHTYDHDRREATVLLEDPLNPGNSRDVTEVSYDDLEDPYALAQDEETAPVFYSEMQQIITEKLPKKISPDDLLKFLKGKQVKDVELEWSGIADLVAARKESGVRSIDKQEIIDYLADPLNAYDLTETLWESGHYDYPTKWGPGESEYGVSIYDVPGDYKELMISLPGEQVYQSSGHMPGIKNPIVQIRFWEIPNDRGKRIIFIDEMQSDWFARIKDNDWIVKTGASEAEIERLNRLITQRSVELHERVNRELGLAYDTMSEALGYSYGPSDVGQTVNFLKDMRRKLDRDFRESQGWGQGPVVGQENAALMHDWLNSPERALVERLYRHSESVLSRLQRLTSKANRLTNAPHDMPYKKGWEQLALKRMVGWAVQNGFDEVHWTQGIVPAIRYEKTDPSYHLGGGPSGDYESLTDHPSYPDEDSYQQGYTSHEYEFADSLGDVDEPGQERLFGITPEGVPMRNFRWNAPDSWDIPGPVPMGETVPHSMTAKELGYGESTDDSPWGHEYTEPDPGELIYVEEGPFTDQFVRVGRRNEDGSFDVFPSEIRSVRMTGREDSSEHREYEVEIETDTGRVYGSGETMTDALWDAGSEYRALADSDWFGDFESRIDSGWHYETDDYAYQEAVAEFHRDVENGYIEVESEGPFWSAEDVAQLPYEPTGNPYRYDTIVTSNAKKAYKKYGVEVNDSSIPGAFSSMGQREALTDVGRIPTWSIEMTPELRSAVEGGQSFFQAVYPITGGQPVVKGAVELLADRKFRLTLFQDADISTALHELGHIAIYDMDENDLTTLSRELAGGRPFAEWRRDDHERYTRAWERYFRDGYASNTSLRKVFQKIAEWMKRVYNGAQQLGDPISPEIRRVFDKRLGRAGLDEADYRQPENPELTRWGVQLSQAKTELERYEARAEIARQKGTDEALRADLKDVQKRREKAEADQDLDLFNELTTEMRHIAKELDDRDALNSARNERRSKLLATRQSELVKALQKPDSRRYEGATAAADFFQAEREAVLRGVFGDLFDPIFAGRRQQQSAWLAARGALPESDIGEGRGHQPMRRRGGVRARISEAATPVTRRMGKPRTDKLNLHKSNEMILWQQGDYQADINVLHEEYLRALSFGYQHDMRQLLHQIGEPVDVTGPKEGWYLIDLDATPLPREWKGLSNEEIDAELQNVRDALDGDDSQLALQLQHFAENWLHTDPGRALHPEHGYKNVRQVHPKIVHQLMLPYTGNQLWNPVVKGFSIANTLARTSLIYMSPGYIPSNVLANAVLLLAERGIFALRDLAVGARLVTKDRELGRRVRAEMGETMTTSKLRADTGEVLALPRRLEGKLASAVSYVADDWVRAAAWSGIASKHGYRTRDRQLALLDGKTEKTRRDRERISELATRAMIDFDRLSPWEQRYLRPIVFVWPFMRGATAWPIEYVREHPFRAGAAVALTQGYGEQAREELGEVPDYFPSLVPIDLDAVGGERIANAQSITPVGAFGDFTLPLIEFGASFWTNEKISTFRNLAGFLAPQNDVLLQLVRGQGQFGEALSVQEILKAAAPEMIPLPGLPILIDVLDETKPAYQMDQGWLATLTRRTFRFTPQRMNLSILNQQAKARGEREVTSKLVEARRKARTAWNQVAPGEHMPRVIEDSIKAYYIVQANRAALKDEIKKHQRESWQPTKREPSLSPLQEASIVYDVLIAQNPDLAELEDPRSIFDKYGEEGVRIYQRNLERFLYQGKRKADEAIRRAKQVQRTAA